MLIKMILPCAFNAVGLNQFNLYIRPRIKESHHAVRIRRRLALIGRSRHVILTAIDAGRRLNPQKSCEFAFACLHIPDDKTNLRNDICLQKTGHRISSFALYPCNHYITSFCGQQSPCRQKNLFLICIFTHRSRIQKAGGSVSAAPGAFLFSKNQVLRSLIHCAAPYAAVCSGISQQAFAPIRLSTAAFIAFRYSCGAAFSRIDPASTI